MVFRLRRAKIRTIPAVVLEMGFARGRSMEKERQGNRHSLHGPCRQGTCRSNQSQAPLGWDLPGFPHINHLTDEETEAQRSEVMYTQLKSGLNPDCLAAKA